MTNKFFSWVILMMSIPTMYSQIKPESFYISANVDYIKGDKEFENDRYLTASNTPGNGLFQSSISMGMFFTDSFMMGVVVPMNYQVNGESKNISSEAYMISTFGKYYFNISSSQKLKLVLEAEAGFGNYSYEDSKLYSYKYGTGLSYFLNKKVSIDLSVLYGYTSMEPESDRFYLTVYKEIIKGFEPGLGVSFYL